MIITKTPLRCSFFGGGTDFKDYYENSKYGYGSVISTAIDMYVYITVNKRFDDKIRIVYTGNELVDSVDKVEHNIIRNALKIVGIKKQIEIIYSADLPISDVGTGLSSSSALAVGVLNALYAFKGEHVSSAQLAREACRIEIDCIGQKIGIQDQHAVAYGGFRRYRFNSDGSVLAEPVVSKSENLKKLKENLMLVYVGLKRDTRKIFEEQTTTMESKMQSLDKLVEMVDESYDDLQNGNINGWGHRLDKAWNIKKSFAQGVSNSTIDAIYEKAKENGALGGKILGAGGGGFILLYVPKEEQEKVRMAMKDYQIVPFNFEPLGSRIIFMDRGRDY